MGQTHLNAYHSLPGVNIRAVADLNPDLRSGKASASGNIEGQAQAGPDLASPDIKKYADGLELIADPDIDIVDICVPTPGHLPIGLTSLKAGKHTLIEKPLARTHEQALQLVNAAQVAWDTHQAMSMCAMCMRFWPGWDWLKKTIDEQTHGRVLAAHFRRVTSHPGGAFYLDGKQCGGALLDLHIHDSDFVQHALGMPEAVFSRGYSRTTGETDHVVTQYLYGENGPLVSAEGGWAMTEGFGFEMQYTVNFEQATAIFDLGAQDVLTLIGSDGKKNAIALPEGMGYDHELAYFIDCINQKKLPQVVTLQDASDSLRIVEAEAQSIRTGQVADIAALPVA